MQAVPKTILNDRLFIEGAVPEPELAAAVSQAAVQAAPEEQR